MKFTKYLFTILCATSLCLAASAQQAGVNTLLPGGNTILRPGFATWMVWNLAAAWSR